MSAEKQYTTFTKEEEIRIQHLFEKVRKIRGTIIDSTVAVENVLDDTFAAEFFPKDTDNEYGHRFKSFILYKLTFKTKIEILRNILKARYKKVFDDHPSLFDDFDSIRDLRNEVAHAQFDNAIESLKTMSEDKIQFTVYKKGQSITRTITSDEANLHQKNCFRVMRELIDISIIISAMSGGHSKQSYRG
ncbi:hypothetical protein ACFLUU_01475 [Chloroflexota bacterium]